jgi:PAS domain S-box-containing protein
MSKPGNLFHDLCESASDLIQSVSLDGRFLYVNRAWLDTLGYTREEVGKLQVEDIIHPDSRAHCAAVMQQVMAGDAQSHIDAVFLTKTGQRVLVEGSASCRRQDGKPVSTCGIFRDVTERRRTEEDLARFFQLSLDLLCVAGTDGYFKRINPAFERVLGYSREELLRHSFVEFVHPDDREITLVQLAHLREGRNVIDFHNRYLAKDGRYRWLAWRSAPRPGTDVVYAVARDITEQKHTEELLARQADELSRSNADLTQFASTASHDLRAPLRTVANLAQWIEDDLGDRLPERSRKHLEELRQRVRRMEQLTDDLLTYARAGRRSGEIVEVDTAELVREVTDLLAPAAGWDLRMDSMPVLRTARAPLEQVFRNLIGNALQHHDRPPGRVEVRAKDLGDAFEFRVRDDGPGISPELAERAFEMFQQGGALGSGGNGSGIGLALVKRIVETQGGRVELQSGKGRGTTVLFVWPKRLDE